MRRPIERGGGGWGPDASASLSGRLGFRSGGACGPGVPGERPDVMAALLLATRLFGHHHHPGAGQMRHHSLPREFRVPLRQRLEDQVVVA